MSLQWEDIHKTISTLLCSFTSENKGFIHGSHATTRHLNILPSIWSKIEKVLQKNKLKVHFMSNAFGANIDELLLVPEEYLLSVNRYVTKRFGEVYDRKVKKYKNGDVNEYEDY